MRKSHDRNGGLRPGRFLVSVSGGSGSCCAVLYRSLSKSVSRDILCQKLIYYVSLILNSTFLLPKP